MVKLTQTVLRQFADNCLSLFDHSVRMALKGLRIHSLLNTLSDQRCGVVVITAESVSLNKV